MAKRASVRSILRWLKASARHASIGAWPFWACAIIPISVGLVAVMGFPLEPSLRLVGMAFQIFGFGMSMLMLVGTARAFQAPHVVRRIARYFANWPRLPTNIVVEARGTASASFHGSAVGVAKTHSGTPDERLRRMEEAVEGLREQAGKLERRLDRTERELTTEVRDSAAHLQRSTDDLGEKLQASWTGGLTIQWIGLLYFIVGVTMATASVEIAKWLSAT